MFCWKRRMLTDGKYNIGGDNEDRIPAGYCC